MELLEDALRLDGHLDGADGRGGGSVQSKYAGTVANQTGVGTKAWTNPDERSGRTNLGEDARDGSKCGSVEESNYLKATNFGFAIPTTATITGVQVAIFRDKVSPPSYFFFDKRWSTL
jgi:hypothetical protein